jgi:hypothetical protein
MTYSFCYLFPLAASLLFAWMLFPGDLGDGHNTAVERNDPPNLRGLSGDSEYANRNHVIHHLPLTTLVVVDLNPQPLSGAGVP